jgi:hypothetical protein
MVDSQDYKDWREMRRLLFHRIHPGRNFSLVVGGPNSTTWIGIGKAIDQNTTAIPRKWLASTVKQLLIDADTFVSARL